MKLPCFPAPSLGRLIFPTLALSLACLCHATAQPKVPDLTKGESPAPPKRSNKILAGNLGPTGLIGWMHHEGIDTGRSRQILITEVAKGSPADGVIRKGDVILGASGQSASPADFTADARRSFAEAIADAEARKPATLHLKVWREGTTANLALPLEFMGAYAANAPYDCPKSLKVIERAMKSMETQELKADRFGLGALALLACEDGRFPGNEARRMKAREWVTGLIPDKQQYEGMISDQVETYSKVAWNRTYHLIVLAEYYLATGDNPSRGGISLLQAIDAHAQTIARGQSMFGTMGHQFALQGENGTIHGPYGVGYGPINATGLAAFMGLTLARDCQLPNAETNARIEAAIQRASVFFSYYANRGTIPYGEHAPWKKSHCSNGKSGLAAAAFARVPGREQEAKYFSQLAVASGSERPGGHGGSFFNYLWTPVGAKVGGEDAMAAYFRQVSWHLDLARTWDGGFYYNDYGSHGYHGPTFGKASLYMSSPALLTYAMGLRKLHLTGKSLTASTRLSKQEVADAWLAGNYRPAERSEVELLEDLGSFSAVVRERAAATLAANREDAAMRARLQQIALVQGNPSRRGAVTALGMLGHPDSAKFLIELFRDEDTFVREEAIEAFGMLPAEVQASQVDALLKKAAALKRDPMKVYPDDPMNTNLIVLTDLLFDSKGIVGSSLRAVQAHSSMEQLYGAIRASATLPAGGARTNLKHVLNLLSPEELRPLADTLMELVEVEAPADAMFAEGPRSSTAKLLLSHRFEESVDASLKLFEGGGRWTKVEMIRAWAKLGPALKTHKSWPRIEAALKGYRDDKFQDEGPKALAAINKPGGKVEKFIPLR